TVFPLGITDSVTMTDSEPSAFKNGLAVTDEGLLKPRNHLAGFRFRATPFDIVVRQSDVKRILARNEVDRNKISSGGGFRGIIASIAIVPVSVPGTAIIRDRVVAAWAFAYPKDCRNDPKFPGVAAGSSTERCAP